MSKREAFSAIHATVKNQIGLNSDLLSILHHRDARWAIGDFDLDQAHSQPWPDFLQPCHEPQMRSLPLRPPTLAHPLANISKEAFPTHSFRTLHGSSYGDDLQFTYTPTKHSIWATRTSLGFSSPMLQASSYFGLPTECASPSATLMPTNWGKHTQNMGKLFTELPLRLLKRSCTSDLITA